jgi:hypothetical protein
VSYDYRVVCERLQSFVSVFCCVLLDVGQEGGGVEAGACKKERFIRGLLGREVDVAEEGDEESAVEFVAALNRAC